MNENFPSTVGQQEELLKFAKKTEELQNGAKQENPKSSIYWALVHALDHCNKVAETERSRELSLVITKLEEAQMWYERIYPPKSL